MTKPTTEIIKHNHNFVAHIKDPFCEKQTKLQLTITIVFHTIIFPLGLFRLGQIIYRHCCKRSAIPAAKQADQTKLRHHVTHDVRLALTHALQAEKRAVSENRFAEKCEIESCKYKTNGPNNDKINLLYKLFDEAHLEFYRTAYIKLYDTIRPNVPLTQHQIARAHKLMQLTFAISYYALEDLELFTKSVHNKKPKDVNLTIECFLDRVYACGSCYHNIIAPVKGQVNETMQETWRSLYNDICNKIQDQLAHKNPVLRQMNSQQEVWTRRDLSQAEGAALVQSIVGGANA